MRQLSLMRRLADRLVRHAGRMLPASRPEKREWVEAMRRETDAIGDDRQALGWALGCVFASYAERIKAMSIVDAAIARGVLIFFIALEVLSNFFATIVTVAYKTGHMGIVQAMSGQMPGDDYRPFIPLMNAIPWWVHALWVGSGILYLIAAGLLFTSRRSAAFPLFTGGFALTMIAKVGSSIVMAQAGLQPVVGRAGSVVGRIIQAVPEFILPLAIVLVLWLIWRSRTATPAAA
jgi:hypothetical protein